MQALIDNKSVKAIFFARGGYGSSQLLNKLNYSKFEKHPKWFVGYSDITAFHIALNNLGFETIQGPMMKGFNKDSASVAMLHDALFGKDYNEISIEANANCVKGEAEGRLVGGNLSLIYSEEGTAYDLNATNSILFIEEIIQKYFGDLEIPIVYGISSGHDTANWPLYLGAKVSIKVTDKKATIQFK